MELNRKRDLNKIGIYCILNKITGKIYIGKSIHVYKRIVEHISRLNHKSKDENIHLIRSWHKYKEINFDYYVLEYLDTFNEELLKERELYWMTFLKSTNRQFGYNLRVDTSTKCLVQDETRKRLSDSGKNKFIEHPEMKQAISIRTSLFWKNNPEIKTQMSKKVSDKTLKYNIIQYSKSGEFIKRWNSVKEIIEKNPSYKWNNIYSVCGGYKPTIYGYIWKKVKITSEDIVRTLEKSEIESEEVIKPQKTFLIKAVLSTQIF